MVERSWHFEQVKDLALRLGQVCRKHGSGTVLLDFEAFDIAKQPYDIKHGWRFACALLRIDRQRCDFILLSGPLTTKNWGCSPLGARFLIDFAELHADAFNAAD